MGGSSHDVLVIGSTNVDLLMRVATLPAPGETVGGGVFARAWGGKGANQAVAAARAGARTRFLTSVGDDADGRSMLEAFARDGIDVEPLLHAQTPSGCAMILIDANGENEIAVAPGANALLSPHAVRERAALFACTQLLLLQLEVPADTVQASIALARANGVKVLLNYAPADAETVVLDGSIHCLVVNETEAARLIGHAGDGIDWAIRAAHDLRKRGPASVIVTLGASGVVVNSDEFAGHSPALKAQAIDATAAGDTFCGALACALAERQPMRRAVRFATAAAAISVTRLGAQPSIPTRQEIEARLAQGDS